MAVIKRIKGFIVSHRVVIITGVVCFFAGYGASWLIRSSYNHIAHTELGRYDSGTWIVKVDGHSIGRDYLDRRVALYKEHIAPLDGQPDPLLHDRILRKLIDQYVVLSAAQRSRIFASTRAQEYLWLFLEEAMVNYYLDALVRAKSGGGISLSDSEIEGFYEKNRDMFDSRKIGRKEAIEQIREQLKGINSRMTREYGILARRIELGRLKEGKKITINKELLTKETSNAR